MDVTEAHAFASRRTEKLDPVFVADGVQASHMVLAPGQEVPWHLHHHVSDTFYVVRGPVTIFMRKRTIDEQVAATGEVLQVPMQTPHRVLNGSNHNVELLLIQGVGTYDFEPVQVGEL